MTKHLITTLFFISIVKFSLAQTGEGQLYNQFTKAEKKLNKVYNKLKKKTEPKDKEALIKDHNDWIKTRELQCEKQSDPDNEGSVIANKMKLSCMTDMTLQRTKTLKSLLKKDI